MRLSLLVNRMKAGERLVERGERRWTLREVDARGVPGARAATCLICESTDVIRRFWRYPGNWRSLADDDLAALCEAGAH
jgi:hypothetical protein